MLGQSGAQPRARGLCRRHGDPAAVALPGGADGGGRRVRLAWSGRRSSTPKITTREAPVRLMRGPGLPSVSVGRSIADPNLLPEAGRSLHPLHAARADDQRSGDEGGATPAPIAVVEAVGGSGGRNERGGDGGGGGDGEDGLAEHRS